MSQVIVAYSTRYGSTAEVAQAIAKRLSAAGVQADARAVGEIASLDGAEAVVLAAPLYIGSLLKDARKFLERHQQALSQLPVAVALLGPTSAQDDMAEARKQIEPALAKVPWFKPVETEMFVGAYDPARLRGADKLLAVLPASPLHDRPAADDRDWSAIESWSDALPQQLGMAALG